MNRERFRFKKKDLVFIVVSITLFFQIYLQTIIIPLQYFDEFVTVFCIYEIIISAINGEMKKSHFKLILLFMLVVIVGVIGNLSAKIQTGVKPILMDVGNTLKVFTVYIGSSLYLKSSNNKEKIVSSIATVVRIFVCILFFFMILHELGIRTMGEDMRYGMKSFQFINAGAGQLSLMLYSIILILTMDSKYDKRKSKRKRVYIIMALLVWATTLRSRAFMYIIIYLFLYYILIVNKQTFKFGIKNIIVIVGALVLFSINQFQTYFGDTSTARSNLMRYGVYTMRKYFPIGTGFATYGTDAAVTFYSKLYDKYGFNSVYGLSRDHAMFAHDTYWPAIFAQFGILGTILVVLIILIICKDILSSQKKIGMIIWGHFLFV